MTDYKAGFDITPNPFNDILLVKTVGNVLFKPYDLHGRLVFVEQILKNAIVNTSNLQRGIYIATVDDGDESTSVKLVKN